MSVTASRGGAMQIHIIVLLEDNKLTVFKCRQTARLMKPPCSRTEYSYVQWSALNTDQRDPFTI
jgi:hypothetical protein